MKSEVFYSFSYQYEGVILKKKYVWGEVVGGVLINGFKVAVSEFVKHAKSVGVEYE